VASRLPHFLLTRASNCLYAFAIVGSRMTRSTRDRVINAISSSDSKGQLDCLSQGFSEMNPLEEGERSVCEHLKRLDRRMPEGETRRRPLSPVSLPLEKSLHRLWLHRTTLLIHPRVASSASHAALLQGCRQVYNL
jgi:hypothetical protein